MTLAEIVTIIALLLSPLIAPQVSDWLADLKDKKQRRFRVYRTLMASRARRLAPDHVEALNLIDVEFHGVGVVDSDLKSTGNRATITTVLRNVRRPSAGSVPAFS